MSPTNLIFGVVAEHDDIDAQLFLDQLIMWFEEQTEIPLVVQSTQHDCLQGPPERNNVHVELVWLHCKIDHSRV